MSHPALELIGVQKSFSGQLVHKGLTLSVEKGKTTIVVGQSGAGKSVMLKYFIALICPDAGEVKVSGTSLCGLSRRELSDIRARVSYLFQGVALFDSMTAFENVALPLREKTKMTELQIRDKVMEKLDLVGMVKASHKYPSELSGGMQKRVGLARALQMDPDVVLFDEPTTGLDPETTHMIYDLFADTQRQLGYTALIVSHDLPKVFRIADDVAVLNDGLIHRVDRPVLGKPSGSIWLDRMMELEASGLKGVLF
jgi:phospholipid/cholesterol/gamma-HCH transport system ATP-binding protein